MSQPQQSTAFFVRGPSPFARLIFFFALSIVLMAVDARLHYLTEVRQGFATMLYPLEVVASSPIRLYRYVTGYFSDQTTLMRENGQLHLQLTRESVDLQQLLTTQNENAHLRSLLEVRQKLHYPTKLAEITHIGRDPFVHKVDVNIGSQQGVMAGQAVVDGAGVIGQVTRVYPFTSEITIITDKSLAIPVQVERNGLRAIAFGHGRDETLYVPYLPANVDIREGDKLITSGIDGTYPENLAIANVKHIDRDPDSPFARIVCTPAAGTDRYRQVLIITAPPATPQIEIDPSSTSRKPSHHAPRQH
jgi:rod shape-determining protein MreC